MGIKGRRIKQYEDEPTLLGDVKAIIAKAKSDMNIKGMYVDIEAIVESYGIKIIREKLPSAISGFLKIIDGNWIIGVNQNHHRKRQRFTIAHEFAHFCLHKEDDEENYFEDTTFFRSDTKTSIEYKANEFAAEILMPEEFFRDLVIKGIKKVTKISEIFDVSALAIEYRAKTLNYKLKKSD